MFLRFSFKPPPFRQINDTYERLSIDLRHKDSQPHGGNVFSSSNACETQDIEEQQKNQTRHPTAFFSWRTFAQ